MKFKGKKAIMAAALSAIVATSSFGTAITANAADTYWIYLGLSDDNSGNGSISANKSSKVSVGESITVTATPNSGHRIRYFAVNMDNGTKLYEVRPNSTDTLTYTFTMPAHDIKVRVAFEPISTPDPTPTPTPDPTPTPTPDPTPTPTPDPTPTPTPDPTPTPTPDPTPTPTPDPTPTPTPDPTWKKGDVNLDGYVNSKDATAVLKHVVGLEKLTGQKLINADVNGDGYINAADATEILKIITGIA